MPAVAHAHTIPRHIGIRELTIPLEAPIKMRRISQVNSFWVLPQIENKLSSVVPSIPVIIVIMATKSRRQPRGVQQSIYKWEVLVMVVRIGFIALMLDSFSVDSWFAGRANASFLESTHCMNWDMDEG